MLIHLKFCEQIKTKDMANNLLKLHEKFQDKMIPDLAIADYNLETMVFRAMTKAC